MRKLLAVGLVLAIAPMASATLFDRFDSYADQAEMNAKWTQVYTPNEFELDTTGGYTPDNSVTNRGPDVNYERKMYRNLAHEYEATDADPITFSIRIKLGADDDWWTREYVELRGYEGAGYGDGGLDGLIAIGVTSSSVPSTNFYMSRTLGGATAYQNYTLAKRTEWVQLIGVISETSVDYYYRTQQDPAPVFSHSSDTPHYTFDSVVVGSGLSSNVEVWFDDVKVPPEPASMTLLALGAWALIRRRR